MFPRRRKSNFTAKCLNTFVSHDCRHTLAKGQELALCFQVSLKYDMTLRGLHCMYVPLSEKTSLFTNKIVSELLITLRDWFDEKTRAKELKFH